MRLTAFPVPGAASGVAQSWWPELFKAPPERSTQDLKQGVTQLQGRVGNAFMVVTENPVSFEMQRLANDPAEPPSDLGPLARYATVAPMFEQSALQWLSLER